ncbi:hypothetical protein K438DRAFT_1957528 [Mycena galopus ATCC 62051]|nr:hypothetical protein K438DRAFT_1957528 [Mycena galopus ATCC 62051]
MEESGSESLDELIEREAKEWFKGVDCVCIRALVLTHGLRGLVYFKLAISGPGRDPPFRCSLFILVGFRPTGVFGPTVHEPIDMGSVTDAEER